MKKCLLFMGALLLALSTIVSAQPGDPFDWQYVEDFVEIRQPHGVVVDPDGNIWVQPFPSSTDTLSTSPDTVTVSGLHKYDPSGTEIGLYFASEVGNRPELGVDTLAFTGRGIARDHNGNILVSNGYLYQVDYQTGAFIARYDWLDDFWSLTEAVADANGFIYCTRVVPGGDAIFILDENFELYNIAVDSTSVISRTLVVSPDGKDLYHGAIYPPAGVIHYHSEDGPDGVYTIVDTLLGPDPSYELWGQIIDTDPAGRLWVGSYWDTAPTAYRGWYAFDVDPAAPDNLFIGGAFADSLGRSMREFDPAGAPDGSVPLLDAFWAPRGVAYWEEDDGTWTAYTADFDGSVIKKWTDPTPPTGIIVVDNGATLIREFELRQNFPNPFNPTTSIPFSLNRAADVELHIYNSAGQLVKTLVNERMQAGSYQYDFDASGLASGTYFYRVKFDGKAQTKRMMLIK